MAIRRRENHFAVQQEHDAYNQVVDLAVKLADGFADEVAGRLVTLMLSLLGRLDPGENHPRAWTLRHECEAADGPKLG